MDVVSFFGVIEISLHSFKSSFGIFDNSSSDSSFKFSVSFIFKFGDIVANDNEIFVYLSKFNSFEVDVGFKYILPFNN